MASLKVFHEGAANYQVWKSQIAASYGGVEIETVEAKDVKKDIQARSISGKGPLLVHGGLTVAGSNAILRYVANIRPGSGLYGATIEDSARVNQWIEFSNNDLEPARANWLYPVLSLIEPIGKVIAEAKNDVAAFLGLLNNHLQHHQYLVGNRVTLADIAVASALLDLYRHVLTPPFSDSFGNVNRWFELCVNQPPFVEVIGKVAYAPEEKQPPKAKKQKTPKPDTKEAKGDAAAAGGDDEEEEEKKPAATPSSPAAAPVASLPAAAEDKKQAGKGKNKGGEEKKASGGDEKKAAGKAKKGGDDKKAPGSPQAGPSSPQQKPAPTPSSPPPAAADAGGDDKKGGSKKGKGGEEKKAGGEGKKGKGGGEKKAAGGDEGKKEGEDKKAAAGGGGEGGDKKAAGGKKGKKGGEEKKAAGGEEKKAAAGGEEKKAEGGKGKKGKGGGDKKAAGGDTPAAAPPAAAEKKADSAKTNEELLAEMEDEETKPSKKAPNPLDLLPKSTMSLDATKKSFWSQKPYNPKFFDDLWTTYDEKGYCFYVNQYNFDDENKVYFMTQNLLAGFLQRLDDLRKYGMGTIMITGNDDENPPWHVSGCWLFRGNEIPKEMKEGGDADYYTWQKMDTTNEAHRAKIREFFTADVVEGKKVLDRRYFK